jgi:phenylalanyl-tRNA synthetase alpha subunit
LSLSSAEPAELTPLTRLRERLAPLLTYDGFEFVRPTSVMTVEDAYDKLGVPPDAAIRSPRNCVYLDGSHVLTPHLTPLLLAHAARALPVRCWTWGVTYRARRESATRTQCELLCPDEDMPSLLNRLAALLGTVLDDDVTLVTRPARFPGLILVAKMSGELGSGWQGPMGAAGIVDTEVLRHYGAPNRSIVRPTALAGLALRVLIGLVSPSASGEHREERSPSMG